MPRLTPARLCAAWWTLRAIRSARRLTTEGQLLRGTLPPPPSLGDDARWAVVGTLARRHTTCLVRSLVLQAWDADHGRPRDLIIGVTRPDESFGAHAWLDGDTGHGTTFTELTRRPAPSR